MMKHVCSLLLSLAIFATANAQWNNNPMIGTKFSTIDTLNDVKSIMITDGVVRHQVTVTANATCNSLKAEQPNGNITVKTGVNLTVIL